MRSLLEYTLAETLDAGPVYVIRRGIRKFDRQSVTVKLLRHERPTQRDIARLRHEYMITREIDAPSIIKPYALEAAGEGVALILEDFDGHPLDDILRRGRLSLDMALEISSRLAE